MTGIAQALIAGGVALFVALVGSVGTWFTIRVQNQRTKSEAASELVSTALELNAPLREEVASLRTQLTQQSVDFTRQMSEQAATFREAQADTRREMNSLTSELISLREGIGLLIRQIEKLGARPVWDPFHEQAETP